MSYQAMVPVIGNELAEEIDEELHRATTKFPAINSGHEGYAVILEELDEAWEEIKRKGADPALIRGELIQVAAMAIRTIKDCYSRPDR